MSNANAVFKSLHIILGKLVQSRTFTMHIHIHFGREKESRVMIFDDHFVTVRSVLNKVRRYYGGYSRLELHSEQYVGAIDSSHFVRSGRSYRVVSGGSRLGIWGFILSQ